MTQAQRRLAAKRRNSQRRENPEFSPEEWEALKAVLGYCQRCGSTENLTKEHIVPLSRGGKNNLENLSVLCQGCNEQKGSRKIPNYIPSMLLPSQEQALNNISPAGLRDRVRKKLGYDTCYN